MEPGLHDMVLLVLLCLLLTVFSMVKKQREKRRTDVSYNLPPSLPSLPVLGHIHLFAKPLHQTLADIAGRLGPVVFLRFGSRPVVVVSSPELAEVCLNTHVSGRTGGSLLSFPVDLAAAAGVHEEESLLLLRGFLRETDAAEAEWSVGGAAKVELKSRLFAMAVDAVTRIVAGKRYYIYEEEEEEEEGRRRFREAVEGLFGLRKSYSVGGLLPFLRWVDAVEVGQRLPRFKGAVDGLLQELIDEHRRRRGGGDGEFGESHGRKTLISMLLSQQTAHPDSYSDTVIKEILVGFITAGTDTISNTVEWAMSHLLNNPEKLKKAKVEVEELVGRHRLLRTSDVRDLPYLRCIVAETLRLHPAAPLIVADESSNGCSVDGYDVPWGSMLLVNVYGIHRNPEHWAWQDRFVPERFQDSRAEGGVVLPFGLGRRRCPAEGLAGQAVGVVLGLMIQCLEWERVGREEVDMREEAGMTLAKATPLEALCIPRPILYQVLNGI
ncbi:hypothetical protein HPP92_017867 [Vanilla planifolia]|uniref:Cytochrome P450 n=1 Tax=Vanilla planifolia TaxID=51239 RepID=A0A835QF96_VANPL|nr:hypothetical protein HPP92_018442 [Vanilla planifolia]KAG0468539.1 hypothetical protein HPP92_017867 [Vanilla planifolia]